MPNPETTRRWTSSRGDYEEVPAQTTILEFDRRLYPAIEDDRYELGYRLMNFFRSGDPDDLPRGVTLKEQR